MFRVTRELGGFTLREALVMVGLSSSARSRWPICGRQHRAAAGLRAHRPVRRGAGPAARRAAPAAADGPAAAQGLPGGRSGWRVLVVALRLGGDRLDPGAGGAGGRGPAGRRGLLRVDLRGHRHRGVLVGRVRRAGQRVHLRRAGLHLVPDHRLRRLVPGASSRTAWGSPSSATSRRWRCSAAPTRSACRPGPAGPRRWSRWSPPRSPRRPGARASATTGARGHDASSSATGCARSSPYG